MSLAVHMPVAVASVRPIYILQQLEVIYAIAWTHPWEGGENNPSPMNVLLGTELEIVHVTRIWVPKPHRRRNYGHSLLQHICQDADHSSSVLTLQMEPDNPNDCDWIEGMYRHAGFNPMAEEYGPASMVRWPKV